MTVGHCSLDLYRPGSMHDWVASADLVDATIAHTDERLGRQSHALGQLACQILHP